MGLAEEITMFMVISNQIIMTETKKVKIDLEEN